MEGCLSSERFVKMRNKKTRIWLRLWLAEHIRRCGWLVPLDTPAYKNGFPDLFMSYDLSRREYLILLMALSVSSMASSSISTLRRVIGPPPESGILLKSAWSCTWTNKRVQKKSLGEWFLTDCNRESGGINLSPMCNHFVVWQNGLKSIA